jgi:hypothetical protein
VTLYFYLVGEYGAGAGLERVCMGNPGMPTQNLVTLYFYLVGEYGAGAGLERVCMGKPGMPTQSFLGEPS